MASITIPISGYDESDYSYASVSASYPLSNAVGSTSSSGTKYAGINLKTGSSAESYVYVKFDTSEIPSNATIKSVTGSMLIYGSTTAQSRTKTRNIQFYSEKTAKGTATDFSLTGSATIYEITNSGTWSRSELNNLSIRLYVQRNSSSTTGSTYVYWLGGDVTIEYEIGGSGGGGTDQPSTPATFTIDENMETYQGKTEYISDGSTSSGTWRANASATSGKYVEWSFNKNVILIGFNYQSSQSSEIMHTGCYLQVSTDGSNWKDVGQFTGGSPCNFTNLNEECRYVRIYAKSGSGYVSITEAMPIWNEIQTEPSTVLYIRIGENAVGIKKIYQLVNGQLVTINVSDLDRSLKYVKVI